MRGGAADAEESNALTALEEMPAYCPFCGNDRPEVFMDGDTWGVYCSFCNASVKGYKSRAAAVKQWDHRYKPENKE